MSYDPSHRKPRHSGRGSHVITPEEAWPAVEGDAYADGAGYRGGADVLEPQASYWPAADYRSQPGYQAAFGGPADRGQGYRTASGGYGGTADGYANEWNGWAQRENSYSSGGYAGTAATGDWSGWATGGNGYAGQADTFDGAPAGYGIAPTGYAGTQNGYGVAPTGYADTQNGYAGTQNGYAGAATGYAGDLDAFDGAGNRYRAPEGFAEAQDGFDGLAGYLDHGAYAELSPSDFMLSAPDAGVHPDGWRAEQDRKREMSQRGAAVGAATEFLAVGVAVGVSTLAAAFVRPQASPIITAGNVFIDRLPFSLKTFAVQHFGGNGRVVLLLGMYIVLGLLALEIGLLTRRATALGVAGIAALSLLGAFIVITRPGSRATDVIPAAIGAVGGVAALMWLQRASAPVADHAEYRSSRGGRRRA